MSPLYLYAVVTPQVTAPLGAGLAGEPLRLVRLRGLAAVTGSVKAGPEVDAATLRAHNAVIRRLARRAPALLPARFGSLVPDEPALVEWLRQRARGLYQALALVAGGEQMTLRVYGTPHVNPEAETKPDSLVSSGPGARYLADRLRAHRRAARAPEIALFRRALGRMVRAERVERHDIPPLIVSVHHLVPRGSSARYRATLSRTRSRLRPLKMRATGPWPPYAFVPAPSVDEHPA